MIHVLAREADNWDLPVLAVLAVSGQRAHPPHTKLNATWNFRIPQIALFLLTTDFAMDPRRQWPPQGPVRTNADGHSLLSVYPMASATPTAHIARHLSNLSITAQPPSYMEPQLYSSSSYAEFEQELNYMGSAHHQDSGYWEDTRNQAVSLLGQQHNTTWSHSPMGANNHFSQSIFQRTAPNNSYPTPPPGIVPSSSSLANALGPIVRRSRPVYTPQESTPFFNSFLQENRARPVTPPPAPVQVAPVPVATPQRKRKRVEDLEAPSSKRLHTPQGPKPVVQTGSTGKSRRTKVIPYIQLPARPKGEAAAADPADSSEDDLGGHGEVTDNEEDVPMSMYSPTKSAARGDRDDRAPLDKFVEGLENLFEAEDGLSADPQLDELPLQFFCGVGSEGVLISPAMIRKLNQAIDQIITPARQRKRQNSVPLGAATPRRRIIGLADANVDTLNRFLKMLARSVKTGEEIDPFAGPKALVPSTPKKFKKKGGRKRKQMEDDEDDDEMDVDGLSSGAESSVEPDFGKLSTMLTVSLNSILAAKCCIALLASDRLSKQLYQEELILLCLRTIQNHLEKVVYPFVEASHLASCSFTPSAVLAGYLNGSSRAVKDARETIAEVYCALVGVLPCLTKLVHGDITSETLIVSTVNISIGPFFVPDASDSKSKDILATTFGKNAMAGLRLEALALVRTIFSKHELQRTSIIEEILSSLIKLSDTKQKAGSYVLRDGKNIKIVSALLLQLVQTCAHDASISARKINKERQQAYIERRNASFTENAQEPDPFLDEWDRQDMEVYKTSLDWATKASKLIFSFLTKRFGTGKATKNANEAEYRAIFDNLIQDLLVVLNWPEWPAASLMLNVICKSMIHTLNSKETASESNAAKTTALDHLGVIAARLQSSIKARERAEKPIHPLTVLVRTVDVKGLGKFLSAHVDISSHLQKRLSGDQSCESAIEFFSANLGHDLTTTLITINGWKESPETSDLDKGSLKRLNIFAEKLKTAMRVVWNDDPHNIFDVGSPEEVARVDKFAEDVGSVQTLVTTFKPILHVVLHSLQASVIFVRTKALKALGQIVTSDPTILSDDKVCEAIDRHLQDQAASVRDAAVELVGKYMVESPEVAGKYYDKIAGRIADTGLSVRKRVIKLLKTIYASSDDVDQCIDIGYRLVLRVIDEDEGVQDLAVKIIEEMWFPPLSSSAQKPRSGGGEPHDKGPLLAKVAIIMGVSARFRDNQGTLETVLRRIIVNKTAAETPGLHKQYEDICQVLIDGLVDASDLPGFSIINCVRTIYLFTSAHPPILSVSNAGTLLPYLKNETENRATTHILLKIFSITIPSMPNTAVKFARELQANVMPCITKPTGFNPNTSPYTMREAVSCLSKAVNISHDYQLITGLLRGCNVPLQRAIEDPVQTDVKFQTQIGVIVLVMSLLCEQFDFDGLRTNPLTANDAAVMANLQPFCTPIIPSVYQSVMLLWEKYSECLIITNLSLLSLGFLFRSQPTLMTSNASTSMMDEILSSDDVERRGRVFKVIQDFLQAQADKHSQVEKENLKKKTKQSDVNMEELVGNTSGFAETGVSSAIVQRYMNQILEAALHPNPTLQQPAVDILSFTVKQGLAHPFQSFPVIIALETSPVLGLSARAGGLHSIMHDKHASIINNQQINSARKSFEYQRLLASGSGSTVYGYRDTVKPVTALLQRWYSTVRDKRGPRLDFQKALIKAFDMPLLKTSRARQADVDFVRYMAENFSAFDYKTQEEVYTVIKTMTRALSTTGTQLFDYLNPDHLMGQLHGTAPSDPGQANVDGQEPYLNSSIIVCIIMGLKAHLKTLYGLSEDKCTKFVVGKKSPVGDKAPVRRNDKPISWANVPFAIQPMLTSAHLVEQKLKFCDVWEQDGLTGDEPADEEE